MTDTACLVRALLGAFYIRSVTTDPTLLVAILKVSATRSGANLTPLDVGSLYNLILGISSACSMEEVKRVISAATEEHHSVRVHWGPTY